MNEMNGKKEEYMLEIERNSVYPMTMSWIVDTIVNIVI